MRVVLRPGHPGDQIVSDGHEAFLTPIFQRACARPDSIRFIDIGAHVGRWTLRAAVLGVHTVAIEPQAPVRDGLKENLRANGVQDLVTILPYAMWDSRTNLNLDLPNRYEARNLPPEMYGGNAQEFSACVSVVDRKTAITVEARTLDDLLFNGTVPTVPGFVKIDVEGAEAFVLRGMEMALRQYRPHLLIEMHDCYYGKEIADEVIQSVQDADYGFERIPSPAMPQQWYMRALPFN